ncbi:uncharacterized protein LOC127264427 [Andrographis paniculata]|uniref:uncharacterized protein LOC127264427 n=1 Tax=Andrographis paniculata TaxID=175694 RepID=UPI0021E6F875|nr:uncharacterized protein LOC127264427 [Andrographis paniculata]
MVLRSKNSSMEAAGHGWRRMGFLLIFFPEEDNNNNNNYTNNSPNHHTRKPYNYSNFHFLQSTLSISIFSLLLFTGILLYIFSTLPSAAAANRRSSAYTTVPRRQIPRPPPHALQGLGILYRRGVRAMADLIVAHAADSLSLHELRLFLRLFHRSTAASRSDLLIIFPTRYRSSAFDDVVLQENDAFLKMLALSLPSSDAAATRSGRLSKRESGETIWGRRTRSNSTESLTESTRTSYGSVVGFDVQELDPENSLSGFMDNPSIRLRRWACYPLLLGRVRRNFKHVMLVDMKEFLLLGDPLNRVRTHRPESVILKSTALPRNVKKNTIKDPTRVKQVNPGIIMGGSRGIRRLAGEMLTAIVRASVEQQTRKKNPFTESDLFNQLVRNEYVLKNVNVVVSTESVPELGSGSKSGPHLLTKNYSLQRSTVLSDSHILTVNEDDEVRINGGSELSRTASVTARHRVYCHAR